MPCLLVALILWAGSVQADQAPAIGLIIDDMGYDLARGRQALRLPGAVTYAFLPRVPHTPALTREAAALGREIMLHLPMQAVDGGPPGPGGLTLHMTEQDIGRAVADGLAAVPGAVGVNNHMGSLLTRYPGPMGWLMSDLAARGDLYFVDSRTSDLTVAEQTAAAHGLPAARRDVFLDNDPDESQIAAQLELLVAVALRNGNAIGIAHPYPETLAVLRRALPDLARRGVGLLPVSRIIERQRRSPLWPVSSSPSPQVVKSSKP